jgi:hypothetical protein
MFAFIICTIDVSILQIPFSSPFGHHPSFASPVICCSLWSSCSAPFGRANSVITRGHRLLWSSSRGHRLSPFYPFGRRVLVPPYFM